MFLKAHWIWTLLQGAVPSFICTDVTIFKTAVKTLDSFLWNWTSKRSPDTLTKNEMRWLPKAATGNHMVAAFYSNQHCFCFTIEPFEMSLLVWTIPWVVILKRPCSSVSLVYVWSLFSPQLHLDIHLPPELFRHMLSVWPYSTAKLSVYDLWFSPDRELLIGSAWCASV